MVLLLAALLAGVFSALSPCVLPLIPMMLGTQAQGGVRRSLRVLAGLGLSVIVFSILLKSTTLFIDIPREVWQFIGGVIIGLFGASLLWPNAWEQLVLKTGFATKAQQLMSTTSSGSGNTKDYLLGASLGPLFNVCSPTYALIVATILPVEPLHGLLLLVIYTLGLTATLYAVAVGGSQITRKLGWTLNPHGAFRRVVGALLLALGIAIILGYDKLLQTALVSSGFFDWQILVESFLAR
jgi:cytochrome c-type biogenesis protein